MDETGLPRYYANMVNIAGGAYDVTLTFIEMDGTNIAGGGPSGVEVNPSSRATCQVVMPLGHAKAMVPLLVKIIADYEEKVGEIPSPGFEDMSKD